MNLVSTLHNHTTLCDGASTPREMAEAAIQAGFTDLGISGHSYAPFDPRYSIPPEREYLAAIRALREAYRGRLRIWCGLEQDHFAPTACRGEYDYIIGSVHYAKNPETGAYETIDGTAAMLRQVIDTIYRGDALACARGYFQLVGDTVETYRPDVVGHFDVIAKTNRDGGFFDEDSREYRAMALEALERCAATGAVFEVNTGAVGKGYRDVPYPAPFLLERLRELGAPVMLSADCHDAKKLTAGLSDAAALLRRLGFRAVKMWVNGSFEDREL